MLAPNEMVLSPSEIEQARAAGRLETAVPPPSNDRNSADAATAALSAAEAELSTLRTQLKHARERQALLEALTGVQIADTPAGDEYVCSLFAEPRIAAAHWRAKYVAPASLDDTKALRYRMCIPDLDTLDKNDPVMLSYLGPAGEADPELVQRLPEHFRGQVSVKAENAPLFAQRLQSIAHGP
ncbi:hypothetical protein GLX27_003445 [Malassezia furfur]|uniref:Uncharacterized protein n=1 Tax=Malassezia furfur TaxID=55194 RepID=A0ABY8EUX9_MALFU|nr:hypothetical protein GLX27_003445 [Malassezia furfur]